MRNALKDLSTITTIPYNSIVKLMDKLGWVISDCVEESTIKGEDYAQIDLGIGKLDIAVVDDEVHYRGDYKREERLICPRADEIAYLRQIKYRDVADNGCLLDQRHDLIAVYREEVLGSLREYDAEEALALRVSIMFVPFINISF